jgi:hypothetical protein
MLTVRNRAFALLAAEDSLFAIEYVAHGFGCLDAISFERDSERE